MTVHPLEHPYYYVCLLAMMVGWLAFTLAFVLVKPQTPAPSDASAPPVEKKRDRRSMFAIGLQSVGYFFMWLSFRPPFPTLSLVPGPLAAVLAAFAFVLAFCSGFMAVWARRTLGKEWTFEARLLDAHRLVTTGPYAIVRHPIYAAMLGLWFATALAVARPWGIVIGLPFMLVGTWMRVKIEDSLLRGAFGEAFESWAKKTPAIVPGLRGVGAIVLLSLLAGPARGADCVTDTWSRYDGGRVIVNPMAKCATDGTWNRYDGEHVILYTNTSAEHGLRDAHRFETFAWMLDQWSPELRKRGAARIVAIGFASEDDYRPFRTMFEGKPVETAGSFVAGPFGKMLQFMSLDLPEYTSVIHHEYVHALTYDRIGNAPPWAAEGFAEFFSTFEPVVDQAMFGHPIPSSIKIMQNEEPFSIAELTGLRKGHDYYHGTRRGMLYAESWALVHYLIRGSSIATFERAVRAICAGDSTEVVLAREWPSEDWSTLPSRLRGYVEPDRMDSFRFPMPTEFVEPYVKTRPVPRSEILGVLGDLLVHQNRMSAADALAYYRAALEADAQSAAAVCGLAVVNQLRDCRTEADVLYKRAAAMPSASATTLGHCAVGIMQLGSIDSTASAAAVRERLVLAGSVALRALSLQPDEPLAVRVVAALADRDSAFAAQAIPVLEAAHEATPRNTAVTSGLVCAYLVARSRQAAQALYDSDTFLQDDAEEAKAPVWVLERAAVREADADFAAGRTKECLAKYEAVRTKTKNVEGAAFLGEQIAWLKTPNKWIDRYFEALRTTRRDRKIRIFEEVQSQSPDARLVYEAGRRLEEITGRRRIKVVR